MKQLGKPKGDNLRDGNCRGPTNINLYVVTVLKPIQ